MHTPLPTLASPLQGGLYAGVLTAIDGQPYVLVLLPDRPAGPLTWAKAKAWAKKLGAELPNRTESAHLFAALQSQFDKDWHWTCEASKFDASYAWSCHFVNGFQYNDPKSAELCARAVRRLPLRSFNPLEALEASEASR